MSLIQTFITALGSLVKNKTRSLLTMLGVIIGVFAVISLVSLVQGIKNVVTGQFSALGSNLVLVAPGRISFNTDPAVTFSNNKLEARFADKIARDLDDIVIGATPNIRLSKTVEYKNKKYLASLVGVNSNFTKITDLNIVKGRAFNKGEEASAERVAVIGPEVEKTLFIDGNSIGKNIKISGVSFEVVGVIDAKGFNSDERVIVPYTTLKKSLNVKNISGLTVKVKNGVNIDDAMDQVELVLLSELKKDEFGVISQKDVLNSIQSILNILSIGLGAIASISLIVGGIGIMNIMLVSVTERIAEIGLRKALGASPKDIAAQFIIESTLLASFGGLIGIGLGYLFTFATKGFLDAEVPLWTVGMGFGFSLLVGVIFGSYPAITASKLDPIEALRHEL